LRRARHRPLDGVPVGVAGRALVEHHGDVAAEERLHPHALLGREALQGSVDVRAEGDAVVVHGAQLRQREHLEPAAVGEHRARPPGEAVQASERMHHLGAGAQPQVVGVAEHDARVGGADLLHRERLDGADGADGHEGGRLDRAVGRLEEGDARVAVARQDVEGEAWCGHHRRARTIARGSHRTSMASP
jgi:hypothetical protein